MPAGLGGPNRNGLASANQSGAKGAIDKILSIGAYSGETDSQRGRRRVMVGAIWMATLLTLPTLPGEFAAGYVLSAWGNVAILAATAGALSILQMRPLRFALLLNLLFVVVSVVQLIQMAVFGGLVESVLVVVFSLIVVFGALVALGVRAAFWWFAVFVGSVAYAVAIPNVIDPIYLRDDAAADTAFNLVSAGAVIFAAMVYFVRQRDRFQKQSDDLLHNILPAEIASRLKADTTMIADFFESASVLFVDVVDFTPLSAGMSAIQLVDLLNSHFRDI